MVCDDCFETKECRCGPGEMCGVCFESRVKPEDVPRILTLVSEPEKPILRCKCGARRTDHDDGAGACYSNTCMCAEFRCDHTRCGWKPREEPKRLSLTAACACSHVNNWHVRADHNDTHCAASDCPCGAFRASSEDEEEPRCLCGKSRSACDEHDTCDETPDEPPLTPEEEEEVAAKAYSEALATPPSEEAGAYMKQRLEDKAAPPQPERRPPYAVSYSVQGHLFEVALSGDATVRAVDGALVIQHHLGPIAGIVSVLPVINKESA